MKSKIGVKLIKIKQKFPSINYAHYKLVIKLDSKILNKLYYVQKLYKHFLCPLE